MFNENDLRFAAERHKDLEAVADQARLSARLSGGRQNRPLWVRALNVILDRSRWTLVQKSESCTSVCRSALANFP